MPVTCCWTTDREAVAMGTGAPGTRGPYTKYGLGGSFELEYDFELDLSNVTRREIQRKVKMRKN